MGSGDDKKQEGRNTSGGEGLDWLDDIRDWDDRTRRRFLALLVTIASGILGAIFAHTQGMFQTTPPETDERIDRPTDDPPVDIFVQEHDDEYRATYADGALLESGSDGWAVLETAIDTVPNDTTIFVNGRYEADSVLEVEKSLRLEGQGGFIEVTDSAETALSFRGTERYETELESSVDTGDHTVELATTDDISQGDVLLFEEVDGPGVLGRGQPPGEPHSVLEVDDNTITLEDTVVWREGYDSGTRVYVLDPIEINCDGFTLEGPGKDESHVGIIARYCRNSTFEDLELDKFGSRAIALEGCANSRVRDCTVRRSADIDGSDGYGIQIRSGCHDIVVEGCTAKECRHPFSVTPAGPREVASRSLIVRDCFVSADGSAALNCHGGSAHDIRFEGCKIHTWGEAGVRTGAQKTSISGCEFRMDGHHAITTRNDGQEMVLTVTDTDIHGASNAVGLSNDGGYDFAPLWKLAHIDGVRAYDCRRFFQLESGTLDRVRNLVIRNCSWDTVRDAGIRIENRIDGGSIEGNTFGDSRNDSHIRVRDREETSVENLHITGNRFHQSSNAETFIRLSHATKCVISNNEFESDTGGRLFTDETDATANIVKQNTYFGPGASNSSIEQNGSSTAADNYFIDTS